MTAGSAGVLHYKPGYWLSEAPPPDPSACSDIPEARSEKANHSTDGSTSANHSTDGFQSASLFGVYFQVNQEIFRKSEDLERVGCDM